MGLRQQKRISKPSDRRKYPRQDVQDLSLRATVILAGMSLLNQSLDNSVEITMKPVNVSRGGICLSMEIEATWDTMSLHKEVGFILEKAEGSQPSLLRGRVVRMDYEHQLMGLEFPHPVG